MLRILKVKGDSMLPRFRGGDYVLVSRLPVLLGRIRVGDVVAFRHAEFGTMVKRVARVLENEHYHVQGSHQYSVDSRRFGPVHKSDLIGRLLWHVRKPLEGSAHDPSRASAVEEIL
jgi:nickel-type superoxide dismutase maturation protease